MTALAPAPLIFLTPHAGPVHHVQSVSAFFADNTQRYVAMLQPQRTKNIPQLPQFKYDSHGQAHLYNHRLDPMVGIVQKCEEAPLIHTVDKHRCPLMRHGDVPQIATMGNIFEGTRMQKAEGVVEVPAVVRHAERQEKVPAKHDRQAMIETLTLPTHVPTTSHTISTPLRAPVTCASPGPAAVAASVAYAANATTGRISGTAASAPLLGSTASSIGLPETPADVVPPIGVVSASLAVAKGLWPRPEDDDYDPAKPEYMIPMALEDRAREEARMLEMQIAALERRLHREEGDSNKKVTEHYLDVVDVLRRSRLEAQHLAGPWAGGIPEEHPCAQVN